MGQTRGQVAFKANFVKHGDQRRIALRLGEAETTISKLKNGSTPSFKLAAKIERVLGIPAIWWLDEIEQAAQQEAA